MVGSYRKPWDESQVEGSEVADNLVTQRTGFGAQPRTRKAFPSRMEGRDGDSILVVNSKGTFECKKILGRWHKTKLEEA